jgi:hypothetical protein
MAGQDTALIGIRESHSAGVTGRGESHVNDSGLAGVSRA